MRLTLDSALHDFQRFPSFVQAHDWAQVTVGCSPEHHTEVAASKRATANAPYTRFSGPETVSGRANGLLAEIHQPTINNMVPGAQEAPSRRTFGPIGPSSTRFKGHEKDIGLWIRANFGRANITFSEDWPATMSPLLEAYLHYRIRPRFEDRRRWPPFYGHARSPADPGGCCHTYESRETAAATDRLGWYAEGPGARELLNRDTPGFPAERLAGVRQDRFPVLRTACTARFARGVMAAE